MSMRRKADTNGLSCPPPCGWHIGELLHTIHTLFDNQNSVCLLHQLSNCVHIECFRERMSMISGSYPLSTRVFAACITRVGHNCDIRSRTHHLGFLHTAGVFLVWDPLLLRSLSADSCDPSKSCVGSASGLCSTCGVGRLPSDLFSNSFPLPVPLCLDVSSCFCSNRPHPSPQHHLQSDCLSLGSLLLFLAHERCSSKDHTTLQGASKLSSPLQ